MRRTSLPSFRRFRRDSLRRFLWQHQASLAVLYLLALGSAASGLWIYLRHVPATVDLGLSVAARASAHQQTFREVDRARDDLARGLLDRGIQRLSAFLAVHRGVQKGQLYTHAVTAAHEVLADALFRQGRSGRALGTLEEALRRTPLNYWLWYRHGQVAEESGDLELAARSYHEAFKLTLDHPQVADAYLGVLGELVQHEQMLWVADQFERAASRQRPVARVRVGALREPLERRVLAMVGIPVDHGRFQRSFQKSGLPRGERCALEVPGAMFAGLVPGEPVVIQIRFHNIYDGLLVRSMQWQMPDGSAQETVLDDADVVYSHQDHSGGDYFAEFRVARIPDPIERAVVFYSCPRHELPGNRLAQVEHARRNVEARRAR